MVAVKVLRSRYSDIPAQYEQFVHEGRVGCTLRHPNIVPIYDVISQDKVHFLVMAFVEGRNLREFVKIRRKIDPVEATSLMTAICDGMQYAFEHGLTHRDLKMNNVLVSSRGQPMLVDFGLAGTDETLSDEVLASLPNTRTIDYAALERATGVRKDDTRSDIYFLGCIYYNMLTGRPALRETRDRIQRLSRSRFLEVKPIRKVDPAIPDSVALVVNKALMLDPSRRYQSPGKMLIDLEIAMKRMAARPPAASRQATAANAQSGTAHHEMAPGATALIDPSQQPSVMVVESDLQMQDVFREGFKRAGYRVLLTSDPNRALSRFRHDPDLAECVILNALQIGRPALETFNEFGQNRAVQNVPAVLLLEENQHTWAKEAKTAGHRVVLPMPITMKRLRAELAKLVPPEPNE